MTLSLPKYANRVAAIIAILACWALNLSVGIVGEEIGGSLTSKFGLMSETGVFIMLLGAIPAALGARVAVLFTVTGFVATLPLLSWRLMMGVWCHYYECFHCIEVDCDFQVPLFTFDPYSSMALFTGVLAVFLSWKVSQK